MWVNQKTSKMGVHEIHLICQLDTNLQTFGFLELSANVCLCVCVRVRACMHVCVSAPGAINN